MSELHKGSAPALEIKGLNVYYGASHALQGVDLGLHGGVLSVVGRNGMGKTTLCKAIMGLEPASSGTISFGGQLLNGKTPAEIARLGVGYVPQGRRLWRSLTVDEHLRLVAQPGGNWSVERIYDSFPRLAERKTNGGAQLSGGEQQMLAIGRALLLNPRLLVMDEPTEGLAPVIVSHVEDMLIRLAAEGDIDVLVIEQNIGVATSVAETVAVMVNGRVSRIVKSRELAADRDLQQRLLGVGQHAHDEEPDVAPTEDGSEGGALVQHYRAASHALPQLTRWSAIDSTVTPLGKAISADAESVSGVLVLAAMDRAGAQAGTVAASLRAAGQKVTTVDISARSGLAALADMPAHQLAAWHPRGAAGIHDGGDGDPRLGIAEALQRFLQATPQVGGIVALLDLGEALTMVPTLVSALPETPIALVSEARADELGVQGDTLVTLTAHDEVARGQAARAAAAAMAELLTPATMDPRARHLALISGLGGDALGGALAAQLGKGHRLQRYAPTRGGTAAAARALTSGAAQAVLDLDQSDFADRLFSGLIDGDPTRVSTLSGAGRPYIAVLNGGERVHLRDKERQGLSQRSLDRAEAEAVGRSYAEALTGAAGEITVIVPTARRDTAAAWLTEAFLGAFGDSEGRTLLRSPAGPLAAETLQQVRRCLDAAPPVGSARKARLPGGAYAVNAR